MVTTLVPLVTTVILVNGLSKTAAMCHHPPLEPPPSWIGAVGGQHVRAHGADMGIGDVEVEVIAGRDQSSVRGPASRGRPGRGSRRARGSRGRRSAPCRSMVGRWSGACGLIQPSMVKALVNWSCGGSPSSIWLAGSSMSSGQMSGSCAGGGSVWPLKKKPWCADESRARRWWRHRRRRRCCR